MNIKQAVVFSVLMQNHDGIVHKSPDYIAEKLELCSMLEHPEQALDPFNMVIYEKWVKLWTRQEIG